MITALACLALADAIFQPINHRPMPPQSTDFWFIAMGDNRPAGAGLPPTKAFRGLLEEISTIDPSFVLSSGDLIYGNDDTMEQYKQEIAWMKPVLDTVPCPFFNVPGNHEINNNAEFLKAYTGAFGPPYGSFEFGGIRFVAMCTELPADKPSVFGEQLDWLTKELDGKMPTVVFEHHPIFARAGNDEEGKTVANAAQLHGLFKAGNVKLVLEGHDHVYNAQTHDGIEYRIAGGSGAPLDADPTDGGYFHFLLVHAKDGALQLTPIAAQTLEVVPMGDGYVAVGNYADADLPLQHLVISSSFDPRSVDAGYSTKKGRTSVDSKILHTEKVGDKFESTIALMLPKHHATFVKLTP